jgi:hypothetical protein
MASRRESASWWHVGAMAQCNLCLRCGVLLHLKVLGWWRDRALDFGLLPDSGKMRRAAASPPRIRESVVAAGSGSSKVVGGKLGGGLGMVMV